MQLDIKRLDNAMVARFTAQYLDAGNVKQFKAEAASLITPGAKVIFDLSSLKFVDTSGLGALLSCLRNLNAQGGDLMLCGMAKPVRALFELVRMHRVFDIFNTEEEALQFAATSSTGSQRGD
jgi:anti-sigma B factor antagonist